MKDLNRLRQQVKAAWAKLPKDVQAQLEPKIRDAHNYVLGVRNETMAAVAHPPDRELVMMHTLLHDNLEGLLSTPGAAAPEGVFTVVQPDGEVYFGGVDYNSTDPWWAYCFTAMVETEGLTPPFNVGTVMKIPDNATLAILGDWGGWNPAAQSIAAAAKASDYIIHLGDVYYAGTNGDSVWLDPYESTHFIDVWPGVDDRSFALNSNYDMYAHATGYLKALTSPPFLAQGGNCFALYNNHFRIMKGGLGESQGAQMVFLNEQIGQLKDGQTLILLTHHNGLTLSGAIPTEADDSYMLWQQVTQVVKQLPAGSGKSVYWYWGHEHAGAVYAPRQINGNTIYPRCCGHGCIPWGLATDLNSPNVLWYETQVLQPGPNFFVTNGYAALTLKGALLAEAFMNQEGTPSWPTATMSVA
jgi:hypothetical protein